MAAKMIVLAKGFVIANWDNVGAFMDIAVGNFIFVFLSQFRMNCPIRRIIFSYTLFGCIERSMMITSLAL